MVAGLVTAMAAPTEKLSDYQTAGLKRVLKSVWDAQGQSMTVDDIAKALCAEQDQRLTDVGEQLFPFTTQGEYGRFFNGQNNISIIFFTPRTAWCKENSVNHPLRQIAMGQ